MKNISEQAKNRFNEEMDNIKNMKEFHKWQFYNNQISYDNFVKFRNDAKLNTNLYNQNCVID